MRARCALLALLVIAPVSARADAEEAKDFETISIANEYSEAVVSLSRKPFDELWRQSPIAGPPGASSLKVLCYRSRSSDSFVGALQKLLVNASIDKVASVLSRFSEYDQLFRGYKEIREIERRRNQILTYWEQRIPVPLVPNVKYRMLYELSQPDTSPDASKERLFRYRMTWSNSLKFSEGFIRLSRDPASPSRTRYVEIDLWDAPTGLGGVLAPSRIVRESFEGVFQTDLALLLRAENPEKTADWAREESIKRLPEEEIKNCIEKRSEFRLK